MKNAILSVMALSMFGCVSPYGAEIRRLDAKYKAGQIDARVYHGMRASYVAQDAEWRAQQNERARTFAMAANRASQDFSAQQQQSMQRSLDRSQSYQYRPPDRYEIRPSIYGGWDVTPQRGTLGFDPYQ